VPQRARGPALLSLFGELNIRLDPWDVQHGSEFPLREFDEIPVEEIILDVEIPIEAWRPIFPIAVISPRHLILVDGVRRQEVRILARVEGGVCHGAFGSYAAGSVMVRDGSVEWGDAMVDRVAVLGGGQSLPQPVSVMKGLTYLPLSIASSEPDAPLKADMECRLARPGTSDPVHLTLNGAWRNFWCDPGSYHMWEARVVQELFSLCEGSAAVLNC